MDWLASILGWIHGWMSYFFMLLNQIHHAAGNFVMKTGKPPKYIKLNSYQVEQLRHVFPRSEQISKEEVIIKPGDSICGLKIVLDNSIDLPVAE